MLDPEIVQPGIIYGLIDGGTMKLRYVGQTIGPLSARYRKHITGLYGSPHFTSWVRSTDVNAVVLERDPENLNEAERRCIKEMREQGAQLLNISDGGNGGFVKPCSLETRAKMSASHMGHPFRGVRKPTAETCAKISAALTGKPKTKAHRKAVMRALDSSPAMKKYRIAHSLQDKNTHCINGHLYDEENTYRNPRNQVRSCRTCARAADKRRYK